MTDDKPLWVVSCPLCRIFSHEKLRTKLYYPEKPEDIKNSEFIIINCETCKIPVIVFRDHLDSVLSESWGRILYQARKLFGENVKLIIRSKCVSDHWNAHIVVKKY